MKKGLCICVFALMILCSQASLRVSAQSTAYRSVQTEDKRIALTFDDGPHPYQTAQILDVLAANGIKATFFMVGENIANYPDAARAVLRAGHEIGNHTYSHHHISQLNEQTLSDEMERCEDILEELGACPRLFRPPEGKVTSYVETCADEEDYTLILWSLDTRDWEGKSAEAIASTVLEHIRPGDIILMHDYVGKGGNTADALKIFLPKLLEEGYEPVTVSELIGRQ